MLKKPIKVAIYSGVSNSSTFIERLISGLTKAKIKVLVFGAHNGEPNASKFVKYHTYGHKINKLLRLIKYSLLLSLFQLNDKKRLDNLIALQQGSSLHLKLKYYPVLYYKPDIFHLQWAKSIAEWIWVKDFGIQLILSLRGAHINYSPIADAALADTYKNLFPKVDGFHAVSKAIAKESLNYLANNEKIHVIYSGLDLHTFPFQQKQKISVNPIQILSVGRTHWKKGYRYALDAMAVLKEKGIDFHYTIIGVKDDETLLHHRHVAALNDYVTFLDSMTFEEVKEQMSTADVLLLPSIEEGIANVVLEAMALGTLVISTDCGGMSEVVNNRDSGFLVPIRNVKAIVDSIMEVYNMRIDTYQSITKKARIVIEEYHTENHMISRFESFYNSLD